MDPERPARRSLITPGGAACLSLSEVAGPLVRRLVGDPELTAAEVADRAGVDIRRAQRLWRALGFSPVADDERLFTRADVEMLRAVESLVEHENVPPEAIVQLTRVTGQALARVAEAQLAAASERLHHGSTGNEVAAPPAPAAIVASIAAVVPTLEPLLGYVWRRHLLAAACRLAVAGGDPPEGENVLTVGFADLVGFTAISQQLDERELAAVVDRFETLSYEQIADRGGRVIKMIGDEVMFSIEDVDTAAEIALSLVEAHAAEPGVPDIRVGLALGPTLSWQGDLFGPTVNLASRLVNIAYPGTVLVSEPVEARLTRDAAFALRHLRPVRLKGIGRVRASVLRRGESACADRPPPEPGHRHARRRREWSRE